MFLNKNYKYNNILIQIENVDDLMYIQNYLKSINIIISESLYNSIHNYLINDIKSYIRLSEHYDGFDYGYGTMEFLSRGYLENEYERVFTVDDIRNGEIDEIIKYGSVRIKPTYKPKGRMIRENTVNEGILNYKYPYKYIIVKFNKSNINKLKDICDIFKKYGYTVDGESIIEDQEIYVDFSRSIYKTDIIEYGYDYLVNIDKYTPIRGKYEKVFTVNDILNKNVLDNIIKYGISYIPNYKPKGKIVRENKIFESLFNEKYPYKYIIIRFNKDNINSMSDICRIFKKYGYNVDNLSFRDIFRYANEIGVDIYVDFIVDNNVIYFGFDKLIRINDYPPIQGKYEKVFTVNDILNKNVLDNIIKYGKSDPKPNYIPKGKIVRENKIFESLFNEKYPYEYIIVKFNKNNINNLNDIINIFKKYGYNIGKLSFRDIFRYANEIGVDIYVDFIVKNNVIYFGFDELTYINVYSAIQGKYEKVFTVNDILNKNVLDNIIKYGISYVPYYTPKNKIIRENIIFEAADNIHLEDGDVLNYYDDDAYAFLFLNGYGENNFLIQQGMLHKNMVSSYLYNLKDKDYLDIYHTLDHDDYLNDILDKCKFKGRIWVEHKIIAFWDLNNTSEDKKIFKNILKRMEDKFNIKIDINEWKVEYFDNVKQKMFFITINDFLDSRLEGKGNNMSLSYYEDLKRKHLETKIKKPVPYGYGSKNPKYKSLEYRQLLYQESSVLSQEDILKIYGFDGIIIEIQNNRFSEKFKLINFIEQSSIFKNSGRLPSTTISSFIIFFKETSKLEYPHVNLLTVASHNDSTFIRGQLQGYIDDIKFSEILNVDDAILLLEGIENGKIISKFFKHKSHEMYKGGKIIREMCDNIITNYDFFNKKS